MRKRADAAAPAPAESNTVVNVALEVGDWIDVMDSEGSWNVAQILSFPSTKDVAVKYDGWGAEYNETVPLNSDRVAPYHTYTWSVKCWARYKNWPWWPSIVTVRSPGTLEGQAYLATENRLFVDFLDKKDFKRRCRCWVELSQIKPFNDKFDDRRKRSSGTDFETSLTMALESRAVHKFPTFSKGTLPKEYEKSIADPVKKMKKSLGMQKWAGFFNSNVSRHRNVYMYKPLNGKGAAQANDDDDDDDDLVVQFYNHGDSDDDDGPKKARAKGKGKGLAKITKAVRPTKGSKRKCLKIYEALEPVMLVEDTATIIEGPHAPSPRDDSEEPTYLPAIDDQAESDAPSIPAAERATGAQDVKSDTLNVSGAMHASVRPQSKTQSDAAPAPAIATPAKKEGSRKRTRVELLDPEESRIGAAKKKEVDVAEHVVDRRENAEAVVDGSFDLISNGDMEVGETTAEENSKDPQSAVLPTTASSPAKEGTRAMENEDAADFIDTGICAESEDDTAPGTLSCLDDSSSTTPSADIGAVDVDTCRGGDESRRPVALIDHPFATSSSNPHEITINCPALNHADSTKGSSPASLTIREITSSLIENVKSEALVDKVPSPIKPSQPKRMAKKSLADETIAATRAALAELDEDPAAKKKRRLDMAPGSDDRPTGLLIKSTNTKDLEPGNVTKPKSKPNQVKSKSIKFSSPASSSSLVTAPSKETADGNTTETSAFDSGRRSSMRAGAKGKATKANNKSQGKTPVWVLPPPKFDPNDINSQQSVSTLLRSPVSVLPTFSSLSLFHSPEAFSLSKWFKYTGPVAQ